MGFHVEELPPGVKVRIVRFYEPDKCYERKDDYTAIALLVQYPDHLDEIEIRGFAGSIPSPARSTLAKFKDYILSLAKKVRAERRPGRILPWMKNKDSHWEFTD